MSAFTGIITKEFKQLWDDAINSLLENTALTTPCLLLTGNDPDAQCPNCIFDPITNRSRNIYNGTGPISFKHGQCPYCHGWGVPLGNTATEIYLMVIWHYRDFIGLGPGWSGVEDNTLFIPFGTVQTLCQDDQLHIIRAAKEILINTVVEDPIVVHRFSRVGEPNHIGLDNTTHIVTTWKRIG